MAVHPPETEQRTLTLEVRLQGGEVITAGLGADYGSAQSELDSLHARLGSEMFVRLGEDTIVRSADVRSVQLREEEARTGLLDSLLSRGGGTHRMSTTETGRPRQDDPRYEATTQHEPPRYGGVRPDEGGWTGARETVARQRPWFDYDRPHETKPFFLTSEFLTLVLSIAGVLIAASQADNFDAPQAWLLVSILAAAYMVSRGLAKAGTRHPRSGDYER